MGFTKLSFRTLLNFLMIYIDSNFSFIVGMIIILNQIVVGGVMNVLISGIIFFCIIVEESGSSLPYWDILNAIFFLQMSVKLFLTSWTRKNPAASG